VAHARHKRETNARLPRLLKGRRPSAAVVAAPLAVMATAGAVSLGVATAQPGALPFAAGPAAGEASAVAIDAAGQERVTVSRGGGRERATSGATGESGESGADGDRSAETLRKPAVRTKVKAAAEASPFEEALEPAAVEQAIAEADTELWTTAPLNLWTTPGDDAEQTGEIAPGEKVLVTGRTLGDRQEIVWKDTETRWVTEGYLSEEEPFTLGGDCTNGTSVPSGVSENIKKVHAAVCAEFPEITTYGTFRSDGEHAQGIAVDIMVSGERGWQVAEFVRKYYADLGVSYVIYSQNIWSVQRSGEGWRAMSDRGSITANHYDHVHVTTY
jgi:hypothetical protein